jgi:hypothetical protein
VKRRVANVLAAISLVLCVATIALWVRGEFSRDVLVVPVSSKVVVGVGGLRHAAMFGYVTGFGGPPPRGITVHDIGSKEDPPDRSFLGFGYTGGGGGRGRETVWFIPYWFLVSASALCFVQFRRVARRPVPGLCPTCGYDLRATPDRCPECGIVSTAGR